MISGPLLWETIPFLVTLITLALLPTVAHTLWQSRRFRAAWALGLTAPVVVAALFRGAGPAVLHSARDIGPPGVAGVPEATLRAISLGTVLFGALTCVGNGPNFLVRGIAAERGIRMPGFLAYAGIAAGLLLPLFVLVDFLVL